VVRRNKKTVLATAFAPRQARGFGRSGSTQNTSGSRCDGV